MFGQLRVESGRNETLPGIDETRSKQLDRWTRAPERLWLERRRPSASLGTSAEPQSATAKAMQPAPCNKGARPALLARTGTLRSDWICSPKTPSPGETSTRKVSQAGVSLLNVTVGSNTGWADGGYNQEIEPVTHINTSLVMAFGVESTRQTRTARSTYIQLLNQVRQDLYIIHDSESHSVVSNSL